MKKIALKNCLLATLSSIILITLLFSCQTHSEELSNTGSFTDTRDGQTYGWVKIGDQIWMSENLNYKGIMSFSVHPDSSLHGRLYEYPEALLACPPSWHLSSDAEWAQLEVFLGMSVDDIYLHRTKRYTGKVGSKLKLQSAWPYLTDSVSSTEETGFNALPSGHYWPSSNRTWLVDTATVFWTSSTARLRYAFRRELIGDASIQRRDSYQSQAYSVRCIKD